MAKDLLTVIFKPEDLQRLLDSKPKKVVIRAILEDGKLDNGQRVGYVKVYAEGKSMIEGTMGETVPGCPVPPCDPNDDTPEKETSAN
ncbi:MAG: hypothetical protein EOO10_11295 [Chitinophagaceae bacterium]|nr:MAG: hypothetical protein EOO10_11295 [Chitinophagaceae bacterium]